MKKNKELKNIVVLGGGTAGWLTALTAKKAMPNANITLVESEEIGILGAGEGTVPPFLNLLDWLQIPVAKVVAKTNATIKNGIKFTDWNGDKDYYYHNFSPYDINVSNHHSDIIGEENFNRYNIFHSLDILKKTSSKKSSFISSLNEENKTPFVLENENPTSYSFFALHFDASQMASYLKEIALDRGIIRVEGKVSSIKENIKGNISSLNLESGDVIDLDFIFDASGFSRFIIGKHYKAEWESHDELPVDSAIPFFLPMDKNIPPYTESTAMKYGWMWKIPLQHRYGCGYVYDSSFITEAEAAAEIEEYLGFEPEYPRKNKGGFKFNAGYYKTPWIKNCISVGLASGFIEPLEATSLWVTVDNLMNAFSNPHALMSQDEQYIKEYNNLFCNFNENISSFIYFHYMGDRNDTLFWEQFKKTDNYPKYIKEMLKYWEGVVPTYRYHAGVVSGFTYPSWYEVADGVNKLNKTLIKESANHNNLKEKYNEVYDKFMRSKDGSVKICLSHNETIYQLKELVKKYDTTT